MILLAGELQLEKCNQIKFGIWRKMIKLLWNSMEMIMALLACEMDKERGVDSTDLIAFLLELSFHVTGKAYNTNTLTNLQRSIIRDFSDLGLVKLQQEPWIVSRWCLRRNQIGKCANLSDTLCYGLFSTSLGLAMPFFRLLQEVPWLKPRNFTVMTGVNVGISCVLKKLRGKEDVQSSMAAAFGSGATFSLVSGMGGPNPVPNALASGLFFALVQGGLFEERHQILQEQTQTQSNIDQRQAYYEIAGGEKKRRVFGIGSQAISYYDQNLSVSSASNTSLSTPSQNSQPTPIGNLEELVRQ